MNTITGTVSRVSREGHTVYGNPIMRVCIRQVGAESPAWFRISDNASLVYAIENAEFRETPHTFVLTRAGRISHVKQPEGLFGEGGSASAAINARTDSALNDSARTEGLSPAVDPKHHDERYNAESL